MLFTPNVFAAENEKGDQPQAAEATFESTEVNKVKNKNVEEKSEIPTQGAI